MHFLSKSNFLFAMALAALAGCVDAIGFMQLGGYFISFMSGNSTRLAVGLQQRDWLTITILLSVIISFVIGAALGTALRQRVASPHKAVSVLLLVSLLLLIAALGNSMHMNHAAMLCMAIAMGAANSVLQSNGDNIIGVTYMTGTLVKMGQRIALTLLGSEKKSWVPYFLLWVSLISGGITGAVLFWLFAYKSLWFTAVVAIMLTIVASRISLQ